LSIAQNEAAGSLTSFELLADIAVDFHPSRHRHPRSADHASIPGTVLMELSSSRDDARERWKRFWRGMEEGIVDDAVIAANLSQRAAFWKLRDEMSAAQKPEGGSIKHDISVPVAAVPDLSKRPMRRS
jgi:FAD/FMN-containing dehydrogenases